MTTVVAGGGVVCPTLRYGAPISRNIASNTSASSDGALSGSAISYSFTCDGLAGQRIARTATVSP
jgi:hypothetical protein